MIPVAILPGLGETPENGYPLRVKKCASRRLVTSDNLNMQSEKSLGNVLETMGQAQGAGAETKRGRPAGLPLYCLIARSEAIGL